MRLTVNGQARDSAAADLDALFREEAEETGLDSPQGIAIALNGAVVRRRDWAATRLAEGDRVEIVRAMQGG
ncbi:MULTISPECIES: sulfur carrier protein ThiS [unclassified Methylobacterium]|uniref:sulfur carrier protein ThiS n=1 Tax=unclassified Methylobacterium TaxID=2615210 RepID=UPI0006F7FA90|nr:MULTISPECIES: sulfur carrier protein ThiS [unclassified Methylobacterium]KQP73328.1 thiamine biosynthesis protein ThiS [Methylobacterium sp. Leaf113]KQP96277.1 thiamine biosynthesis protein ThiS [Methylobacterium sp. Leaf117]MCK2054035.1 sulfur carrier protein ThiS [Methylobacterium sp. 37f]